MLRKLCFSAWKHGRRVVEDVVRIKPNVKVKPDEIRIKQNVSTSLRQQGYVQQRSWIQNFSGGYSEGFFSSFTGKGIERLHSGFFTLFSRSFGQRSLSPKIPLFAFVAFGMNIASQNTENEDIEVNRDCIFEIQNTVRKTLGTDLTPPHEDSVKSVGSALNYKFGTMIAKGCNAAVYEARLHDEVTEKKSEEEETEKADETEDSFILLREDTEDEVNYEGENYDLAVKVMFNLYHESNQISIMRGMNKELLPAKEVLVDESSPWNFGNHPKKKKKRIPAHPNIIEMRSIFVDDMKEFDSCLEEYPDSLPSRLFAPGFGRNKTLYIVMKKYDCTLREYLPLREEELDVGESLLLISQLVEGVLHLNNVNVSHRDLKSDNILIDIEADGNPRLVITDFGCCVEGLQIPYNTSEVDKGGNYALMAPEIAKATSSGTALLDYNKADLWAAGTIAYEVFGMKNPFYFDVNGFRLQNENYNEDMLPKAYDVPEYVMNLVQAMLRREPSERPNTLLVANTLQLILWAPEEWLSNLENQDMAPCPSEKEIVCWLLTLFTEYLLSYDRGSVKQTLKGLFLSRLDLDDVRESLHFLWSLKSV